MTCSKMNFINKIDNVHTKMLRKSINLQCSWYIRNVDHIQAEGEVQFLEVQVAVQQGEVGEVICCPLRRCLGQMTHVPADDQWLHCHCYHVHYWQQCHSHCQVMTENSACVPSGETWTHLDQGPADMSQTPAQLTTLRQAAIWAFTTSGQW